MRTYGNLQPKNWSSDERNNLLMNHPARLHVLLRLMLPLERIPLRLLPLEDGIHLRLMLLLHSRQMRFMLLLDRLQLSRLLRGYRLDLFPVLLQHRLNLALLMHLHSLFGNHGCLSRLFCLIHFRYLSFNQINKKKKPPARADGFSDTAAKPEQPIILKSSVEGLVGANSFARSTSYVRMNSHLQKRHNPLKYLITLRQHRNVGVFDYEPLFHAFSPNSSTKLPSPFCPSTFTR